jgi:hypothetical protein
LLFIPNLFHAEDQPVKSGETAIVVRASRHMSDRFHNVLSFSPVLYILTVQARKHMVRLNVTLSEGW